MAIRFGPLADEALDLAPGMNVIYGPNEAGKSSWHSALYVSLCGVRRGRGQPKAEDRQFAERHRPWEGQRWEVLGQILLDNGRRIELYHELEGGFESRATDLVLGRDVSDEVIKDGAPDGSVWLGLGPRAFLATACVRQAEVLRITEAPALLQDYLQRAAATAGTDETAAQAIEHLKNYHTDHVGLDRANSSRPLASARSRLAACQARLGEVQDRHRIFGDLLQNADLLRSKA